MYIPTKPAFFTPRNCRKKSDFDASLTWLA
jgi:hypothetical protein